MDIVPQDYIDRMKQTETLDVFEPLTKPRVFVRDLSSWPTALQPFLLGYERRLQGFVEFAWNRSLIQWAIKR